MGVVSLYFVGGTWGPPLGTFGLNALGYRLGSQMFFVGDLLAGYFIIWLAYFNFANQFLGGISSESFWKPQSKLNHPSAFVGAIFLGWMTLFLSVVMMLYITGAMFVIKRAYAQNYAPVKNYPALDPVLNLYQQHTGHQPIPTSTTKGSVDLYSNPALKTNDVIFTGSASDFIWNFAGQDRTQMLVHSQNQVSPFTMGPGFIILEVPQQISAQDWVGKQGAFIIRQISNKHNESNMPYYLTAPTVRAFIPLAKDGKSFDLSQTRWFPLVKNATQLETTNDLQTANSNIIWSLDSGQEHFKRRFFLDPKSADETKLVLNTATLGDPKTLGFFYSVGDQTGLTGNASGYYDIAVTAVSKELDKTPILAAREPYQPFNNKIPLKKVELLIPANTKEIEITFNHLLPKTGVWFYEFNLRSEDLNPAVNPTLATRS